MLFGIPTVAHYGTLCLTNLWAPYRTIKASHSKDEKDKSDLMVFWAVALFFSHTYWMVEPLFETFNIHCEFRFAFLLWVFHFGGAATIYSSIIDPFISNYEPLIKDLPRMTVMKCDELRNIEWKTEDVREALSTAYETAIEKASPKAETLKTQALGMWSDLQTKVSEVDMTWVESVKDQVLELPTIMKGWWGQIVDKIEELRGQKVEEKTEEAKEDVNTEADVPAQDSTAPAQVANVETTTTEIVAESKEESESSEHALPTPKNVEEEETVVKSEDDEKVPTQEATSEEPTQSPADVKPTDKTPQDTMKEQEKDSENQDPMPVIAANMKSSNQMSAVEKPMSPATKQAVDTSSKQSIEKSLQEKDDKEILSEKTDAQKIQVSM